jgi:hypothetical protein
MENETPLARGAPLNVCKTDRITDLRTPLWRGRDSRSPEVLRQRFESYVSAFEDFIAERRVAA